MYRRTTIRHTSGGYVLLEVVLALMVFAVAAVGLANALNESIEAMNFMDRQAAIRRGLDAILLEAQHRPKRGEMAMSTKDEKLGIEYKTELIELKFTTKEGQPVKALYALRASATYQENGQPRTDSVEVYVHRP